MKRTQKRTETQEIPEISTKSFKTIIALSVAAIAASFVIQALSSVIVPITVIAVLYWAIAT